MQRINLREFLVYAKVLNHTPVVADSMARIGGGGGVSGGGSFWKTDRSQIYWLITKTDHDVADHEELQDIDAEPTGKTREYTTASGAKATVRELAETDNKKAAISKEEFIIALKAGKVWTLKRFSEDKCFRCFGSGKLGALQKYAKCADCDGTGVIESDLLVKW